MSNPSTLSTTLLLSLNIRQWNPSDQYLTSEIITLPIQDQQRYSKYYFKDDKLRFLAGRLLIRDLVGWLVHGKCRTHNEEEDNDVLKYIEKTEYGRLFLNMPQHPNKIDFNISHHNSYVVIIATTIPNTHVGIDVTHIDPTPTSISPTNDFFASFESQFTKHEWDIINSCSEMDRLHTFYQTWCLKECYVKVLGVGLGLDLKSVEFRRGCDARQDESRSDKNRDGGGWMSKCDRNAENFCLILYISTLISHEVCMKDNDPMKAVTFYDLENRRAD
ncbi:hypothetical protein HDU76_003293 [Blyttiomyces sp. JEL0837]|nr:hypothetical protein HDU76_003293 [Blyttiomyces sp. JEL0837]